MLTNLLMILKTCGIDKSVAKFIHCINLENKLFLKNNFIKSHLTLLVIIKSFKQKKIYIYIVE